MSDEPVRPLFLDVSLDPDPVIEEFKKDVDRALLVENLRRSVPERTARLQAHQWTVWEMLQSGERMRRTRVAEK
jgi:hypothetical protein